MKYFHGVACVATLSFFLVFAVIAGAQENEDNIDSLFGDEVLVQPAQSTEQGQDSSGQSSGAAENGATQGTTAAPTTNPLQGLLKTEAVKIGGSVTGIIGASWIWTDPWTNGFDITDPDSHQLSPVLKSSVYFDARPDEAFRVHGSFKTDWPFTTSSGGVTVPDVRVFELFSDFQLGDSVYFRFGKATVKWGVGYFFSPADIINLEQIDILDPTVQREGPLQFRVFIPYGKSQNTLSFYTIFDDSATPDFSNTALAGKAEFVLGNYELGLSGYYRYDTAERAAVTLTGPLGNFDVFAEGVISRGSPKSFYTSFTSVPPYYTAVSADDVRSTFYPSATAGLTYNDQDNNITAIAQYYYNGEGYSDSDREALINSFETSTAQNTILAMILTGNIKNFPLFTGRHYAAGYLSFSEIGGSDFSAAATGIMNISDLSGLVQPSVTWDIADYLKLSFLATFIFGADDTEYSLISRGRPVTLGLKLSVGTGNF